LITVEWRIYIVFRGIELTSKAYENENRMKKSKNIINLKINL
jgi:hypothetical protein